MKFLIILAVVCLHEMVLSIEPNSDWRNYRKNLLSSTSTTTATTTTIMTTTSTTTKTSTTLTSIILNKTNNLTNMERVVIELNDLNLTEIYQITDLNTTGVVLTTLESIPESERVGVIQWLLSFITIDKYTLIMTVAFISGILLIVIFVLIAICVCKSINRIRKRKKESPILTNPAYDMIKKTPDFLAGSNSSLNKKPIYKGINKDEDLEASLLEMKDINNKSNDSTLTPASSIDSVLLKTPKTPASNNFKSSITNLTQKLTSSSSCSNKDLLVENEKSLLLGEEMNTNTIKTQGRFTPSIKNKTQQQLMKEQQKTNSRHSLLLINKRTKSESSDQPDQIGTSQLPPLPPPSSSGQLSKRISSASSNSSIMQVNQSIDFKQIEQGVDDLINNINLNQSNKSSQFNLDSNSVHNSLSNIYMDAIREKREQDKLNKSGKGSNLINTNRRSAQFDKAISIDPNGSNLINAAETISVNTLGSEKSCY